MFCTLYLMVDTILLNTIQSVLGAGKSTARGNYSFHCPICKHKKLKLEVNLDPSSPHFQNYHCWTCDNLKGNKIGTLFKKINVPKEKFEELNLIISNSPKSKIELNSYEKVSLPKEYKSLLDVFDNSIIKKHALVYLKKRGITNHDIVKYNIGYCETGPYKDRIIIPSYDKNGNLNYFTGRTFEPGNPIKYKNPQISRDIIPFELFINWNLPLVLCEGPLDAIAIKRNAIPLLGKTIQPNIMKKIVTSSVKKIYIALDKDAIEQSLRFCEQLMNEGKEVYLVDLNDKDPSLLGFENFTKLIQNTYNITFSDLFEKKLYAF
jgi:DNA primase